MFVPSFFSTTGPLQPVTVQVCPQTVGFWMVRLAAISSSVILVFALAGTCIISAVRFSVVKLPLREMVKFPLPLRLAP